ncbi:hypothetical protein HOLleu_03903 [Holothuria leucospilota]|uniref:Uncharacterized protein n=1 Tax=Holothuria leucospilota TaxID=206669 RepID=A0A9Q1HM19_HOLLE|nr:hypothetical protein HOLleu_03903 [Holothuria leucospilota]
MPRFEHIGKAKNKAISCTICDLSPPKLSKFSQRGGGHRPPPPGQRSQEPPDSKQTSGEPCNTSESSCCYAMTFPSSTPRIFNSECRECRLGQRSYLANAEMPKV